MIDFYVILGLNFLSPYYVLLHCFTMTVILVMPTIPLVWQTFFSHTRTRVISYVWAKELVSNVFIVYFMMYGMLVRKTVRLILSHPKLNGRNWHLMQ